MQKYWFSLKAHKTLILFCFSPFIYLWWASSDHKGLWAESISSVSSIVRPKYVNLSANLGPFEEDSKGVSNTGAIELYLVEPRG